MSKEQESHESESTVPEPVVEPIPQFDTVPSHGRHTQELADAADESLTDSSSSGRARHIAQDASPDDPHFVPADPAASNERLAEPDTATTDEPQASRVTARPDDTAPAVADQDEDHEVEETLSTPVLVDNDELPDAPPPADERVGPALAEPRQRALTPKRRLLIAMTPRLTRAQVLTALLLGLLGFAIVVQLQLSQKDELAGLRQSELINLLDEVTRRTDVLETEERRLTDLVNELQSGRNSQETAQRAAEQNAEVQGILSGRLPAVGPGVRITIHEGDMPVRSQVLFNVLEELRNAGAEAIEVNGVRLIASSYFSEDGDLVQVDGIPITSPFVWVAIGDPDTIQPALEIPGGAMPQVRSADATAEVERLDEAEVSATTEPSEPRFARPDTSDQ